MRRSLHRYCRHGAAVEIEGQVLQSGTDRRIWPYAGWNGPRTRRERLWVIRVNGRVIDRALTFRRARRLAEIEARRQLVAGLAVYCRVMRPIAPAAPRRALTPADFLCP